MSKNPLYHNITLPTDGTSGRGSYGRFRFLSPNRQHTIFCDYAGEPPHGDSYYTMVINSVSFPGWVWGRSFAFSADSRYFVCNWMLEKWHTWDVVIDLHKKRYFRLPINLGPQFKIDYPQVIAHIHTIEKTNWYTFTGKEEWKQW